jgi:hypothetical protein
MFHEAFKCEGAAIANTTATADGFAYLTASECAAPFENCVCPVATITFGRQCAPVKRKTTGAQCDRNSLWFYDSCVGIEDCVAADKKKMYI